MTYQHIKHLYWRAAFGTGVNDLKAAVKMTKAELVDRLFEDSNDIRYISVDTSALDHFTAQDVFRDKKKRMAFFKKSRQLLLELNSQWIRQFLGNEGLLRHRMTLFWANHFVCKDRNIYHTQHFINTIQRHALGDFGDFAKAISKEAAMLKYLNNKQNKKEQPNENFARELMELFMLGEGQYTEEDIKQSARAFTGYNHNFDGEFVLREQHHDDGYKSFFGRRGRYTGDDIIDIILEQEQCARFICEKIYRYFVNPQINSAHVALMTNMFYQDYNIARLMRFVFSSDWFYDDLNIGAKIKSPIDLFTGIVRTVPLEFEDEKDLFKIQKILGQTLLDPPNVAGWKGDRAWIDANTIMVRLKLPSLLLNEALIEMGKENLRSSLRKTYLKKNRGRRPFKAKVNWEVFASDYKTVNTAELPHFLIQGSMNSGTKAYLKSLEQSSKRDFCIQLMSLPEYQMC